jgi:uncharacterized protein YciU (UPF0263 family)
MGTALVGAGAWFANKLLGPSADVVGEKLKAHTTTRWKKIFEKAEKLADKVDLKPVPPGFAYIALSNASFSEESDEMTTMWARLLLSASASYTNKHLIFADILSNIGTDEAILIENMTRLYFSKLNRVTINKQFMNNPREFVRREIDKRAVVGHISQLENRVSGGISNLRGEHFGWPTDITHFCGEYRDEKEKILFENGFGISTSHEILIRQRILDLFEFEFERINMSVRVQGVTLTRLGMEFVCICRGDQI